MGNLRIGPYVAFVSKFWAVEDVITRSRTASDMWMGPKLAIALRFDCCGGKRASRVACLRSVDGSEESVDGSEE
jgi:hypothetical protein